MTATSEPHHEAPMLADASHGSAHTVEGCRVLGRTRTCGNGMRQASVALQRSWLWRLAQGIQVPLAARVRGRAAVHRGRR
ncbi:hypothetical protein, partial [Xanthomonas campestris]|uniref:hypothetical protein n=1 Tax=Xanthomonas campestris TaxID=339 RepID=UPI001C853C96